ncbi:MAG: sugar transferase [Halanaerobiaceae bacterium]
MSRIFKFLRIIGDIIFINLSFVLAFYIRYLGNIPEGNFSAYLELVPYISLFTVVILHLYSMYSKPLHQDITDIFYAFIPIGVIITIFTTVLSYFAYTFAFPRSVILISLPVMIPVMMFWRFGLLHLERNMTAPLKTVMIGTTLESEKLLDNVFRTVRAGYDIQAIILRDGKVIPGNKKLYDDIEIINGFSNMEDVLKKYNPEMVFLTAGLTEEEKKELLYLSMDENWQVALVPDFYEIMLAGAELEHIGELPVFEMKKIHKDQDDVIKRIFDIFLSVVGLILASPVMCIAAILIKIDSPGPVFFKQKRVSTQGKMFYLYKFRTMIDRAEADTGPVLAARDDNRITRVGKCLRMTRIDEIPQLINVLKGEMSLIGPRPERPHFVEQFEKEIPEYKYRHQIKGGITGLAQVYGYYSTDPEEKLRMDLLYANKSSFLFDLKIILQTMKVIFMRDKSS